MLFTTRRRNKLQMYTPFVDKILCVYILIHSLLLQLFHLFIFGGVFNFPLISITLNSGVEIPTYKLQKKKFVIFTVKKVIFDLKYSTLSAMVSCGVLARSSKIASLSSCDSLLRILNIHSFRNFFEILRQCTKKTA